MFTLLRKSQVKQNCPQKLQLFKSAPIHTSSNTYELWSTLTSKKILFAHRNHLILLCAAVFLLELFVDQYETVSFIPHKTLSTFNSAEEIFAQEQSPFDF